MEVKVLVLADYQLHGADNVVGCGIAHSRVPVIPIETAEVSIGPREENCVVLDWLKERAEDQCRVFLLLSCKAIEGVECVGGNGLRKSETRLVAIAVDKVELHDARKWLLLAVRAILAAVFSLRHKVPHDMGIDRTALSFASSVSRARMVDEEEAWLLIFVLGSSHDVA